MGVSVNGAGVAVGRRGHGINSGWGRRAPQGRVLQRRWQEETPGSACAACAHVPPLPTTVLPMRRWEYSLEELKRDLIEVYAWSTFKTTIDVDGEPADREEAMRPTRMDIM